MKVISNAVSATNCATLAQALVVGKAAGVDLEALVGVMAAGSANSTMVTLKAQPMLAHDFTPVKASAEVEHQAAFRFVEGACVDIPRYDSIQERLPLAG